MIRITVDHWRSPASQSKLGLWIVVPYEAGRLCDVQRGAPIVKELWASGCETLRAIAAGLDERGIPAARGSKWSAVQVARLLGAAGIPFDGSAPNGANAAA